MDIVSLKFNKMLEGLQQKEEERKKIISSQMKKGCNKFSQFDEYFGCNKCAR